MLRPLLVMAAAMALASCGGSVTESPSGAGGAGGTGGVGGVGGSGGSGGTGGAAGAAGSGGMTGACQAPADGPAPYPAVFRFLNTSSAPVWLYHDCTLQFGVSSCDEDYKNSIAMGASCSSSCDEVADGGGCVMCGPCLSQSIELKQGESEEITWPGLEYTFETAQACPCHRSHMAPAGKYRLTVPVWDAAFDPNQGQTPPSSRQIVVDFALPPPGPVVIPLGK